MLNIGIFGNSAAEQRTRVSREIRGNRGVALIWTGVVGFATFLLIALATSVLMMTSSATQVDQIAEYWADTALRDYIGSYGDRRPENDREDERRASAIAQGLTQAVTMANRVLSKGNTLIADDVNAMRTSTEWGTWDYQEWQAAGGAPIDLFFRPGGAANLRCVSSEPVPANRLHENCNALVIRMKMDIQRSVFASLFFMKDDPMDPNDQDEGKIVGISVKAMAAYDERLLQDGLYPYIVRLRYEN